jgi:(R,R)-butanediol dehydrogenase/meso-butanediol dehydrogenase/diacetyl reductase
VRREVFLRTGRIGPDVAIEATDHPDLVRLAIVTVRRGGRVALAGISDRDFQVDLRQVVLYERSVHGSLGYNFDIPRVLDLMATGRLDASSLVTGVRDLTEGPDVFAELTAARERHLKVLLNPKDS